ncbi:MAG TPA: class II fumarate hydratase [Gammaproteobacteria bacterium]|nr:class II fumarate hydratase [Gammaproteobacteria bacterium]
MSKHTRTENDSMGSIEVDNDKLWGAQTQRSLENFEIGSEPMPTSIIKAYAYIKKACATVNHQNKTLSEDNKQSIHKACDDIINGTLQAHFPLGVWQTGSGTQTHMNVNEVIANRAAQSLNLPLGTKSPVHPNDHVNQSQSSNDTFPTAMHIAITQAIVYQILPEIEAMLTLLSQKENEFDNIIKIGRTHLQDAVPLSLSQAFSSFTSMLRHSRNEIFLALDPMYELAIGGTAVGTGLNTPKDFAQNVVDVISEETSLPFLPAQNKFAALSSHAPIVQAMGSLKNLAMSLFKMANDIRFLASGPRCGLGELILPANEPGSSIMPGKVNPTQCESLTMIATQVFGNDATVSFAASQGHFELNVYKPVIAYNVLQAAQLLSEGMKSFSKNALKGLKANEANIKKHLDQSLMLVTALNPIIGYDKAAKIAKNAHQKGLTLKASCVELGYLSENEFDRYSNPKNMLNNSDD